MKTARRYMAGRWSPTTLPEILVCPAQFYFAHLLRVPVPWQPDRALGNVIHYCFNRFFQIRFRSEETFTRSALGFWQGVAFGQHGPKSFNPKKSPPINICWPVDRDVWSFTGRIINATAHFWYDNIDYRDDPALLPETEKTISFSLGAFRIRGQLDRLQPTAQGRYEIWDYKPWMMSEHRVKRDIQMTCYNLWHLMTFGVNPARIIIYGYHQGREQLVPLRSPSDYQRLATLLEQATAYVRAVVTQTAPEPGLLTDSPFPNWEQDVREGVFSPRYQDDCPILICNYHGHCQKWIKQHRQRRSRTVREQLAKDQLRRIGAKKGRLAKDRVASQFSLFSERDLAIVTKKPRRRKKKFIAT